MAALSPPPAETWRGKCETSLLGGNHSPAGMTQEGLQEWPWDFFSDPTHWWDNRRRKETSRPPDFRQKMSTDALWLNNWCKSACVSWQLAMSGAQVAPGVRMPPWFVYTSVEGASGTFAAHEVGLAVGTGMKLCVDGQVTEAVDALEVIVQRGCHLDTNILYYVLKKCIAQKNLVLGRRIHALSVDSGYEGHEFLATHLIGLYASHGRLDEAMGVFSKVTPPSAYMWASIIFAFARNGDPTQAISLYRQMRQSTAKSDNRIFVAVLKACARAGDLAVGKDVHAHIRASAVDSDIFVQTCLIDMYAKCGSLEDAEIEFGRLSQKNVVTWNAMIGGYAQQGMGQEALRVYSNMQQEGITPPNAVTFASLLQACSSLGVAALDKGKQLHAQIEEQGFQADVVLGASLLNMYSKCGSLDDAQRVFDRLFHKDVVTWTAMIAGYAQRGMGQEALGLYTRMQEECITPPNCVTFTCILQACASVAALPLGEQLHVQIQERGLESDVVVASTLVNMYAKCGRLEDARRVFDKLSCKDVVTWTALIAGYAQQGMGQDALSLYSSMQEEGITLPNCVTFVCLLQACASVSALPLGKQLHAQIVDYGLLGDGVVGNSLVNMYAKCGSLEDAQQVFDSLPDRNIVTWGALMAGYACQGDSEAVFDLIERMRHEGIQPSSMSFLSVLSVCSHVGLVDKGRKYFESMSTDFGVTPTVEHYRCMTDLLGRAGQLEEALIMAKTMPFQSDGTVWRTLLGACQKWSNVEVGRQAFEFAVRLDDKDAAAYVLMSNIYVGAQMWEEATEMQARRVKCGAWKEVGQSWCSDMGGVVHRFVAGDKKHVTYEDKDGKVGSRNGNLEIGTCRKLCEDGHVAEAVDILDLLVPRGCYIPNNLFYRLLKRCTAQKDLVLGRRVHALTVASGYESDAFLANHLICMYASHGCLVEVMQVFSKVSAPDAYMWASIVLAYARHGQPTQAVTLYRQMCESTVKPDNRIFVAVLKACASAGNLAAGRDVHTRILGSSEKPDMFVQNALVDMYAKCGSLEEACKIFDRLPQKDVVTWTTMIAGYAQQGMGQEALSLYRSMQQEGITPPNAVTFVSLLHACASVGVAGLQQGMLLHGQIEHLGLQRDVIVGASLVNMYAKCGRLEDAQRVFDLLPQKTVVTWNAMISGYVHQGMGQEALSLYSSMQQKSVTPANDVTFVSLLQACAGVGVAALHQGRQIHAQIEQQGLQGDVSVGTGLVNMYVKCGNLEDARRVFDLLPQKNVVTWNAIFTGYAQQGMGQVALSLYSRMQQEGITTPSTVTFVCLLQACASIGVVALFQGVHLHEQIEERGLQADVIIGNSLVNMYVKCESLQQARIVFNRLPHKDVVTWTAMIAGYAHQGMAQEALSLYSSMQQEGITPADSVIFVCLLQACATSAALPLGKQLHVQIAELGWQADVVVGPSLVNMYAKCGCLDEAQQVFDSLPIREIGAWGALVAGYARQGDSETVFDLIHRMRQEGIQPNGLMFLSILTLCSHVGLVDEGRKYFEAMTADYGISPTNEHYTCMVDLLGRAGKLDEALGLVKTMPFQPDSRVWHTVLGACRKWMNVEVGVQAFGSAVKLDETDAAAYVLMTNIYAAAQMWDKAKEIQARRAKCGAQKEPGRSWWTDTSGVVHSFVASSRKHPGSEDRYAKLDQPDPNLKKEGNVVHQS